MSPIYDIYYISHEAIFARLKLQLNHRGLISKSSTKKCRGEFQELSFMRLKLP